MITLHWMLHSITNSEKYYLVTVCLLMVTLRIVPGGGGGILPYIGYIGICSCEGYGFQAVYFRIGYINQTL